MPPKGLIVQENAIIKEFNLKNMVCDSVIFCIGRRRSGKSYLLREIMYEMSLRKMPYGQIYSATEKVHPYFSDFFPKSYIKSELKEGDMESLLKNQERRCRQNAKKLGIKDGRSLQNNCFLLLDDVQSDDSVWRKSKAFQKVFTIGRHLNIMMLMAIQFVLGVSPGMRQNIDYVFLFQTEGDNDLKKAYENYGALVPNFKIFKKLFYECTNDHGCMVIDRTVKSNKWWDKVFYYKAKDPGKFRFGSPAFWRYHDENYNSSDSDDSDSGLTPAQKKMKSVFSLYGEQNKKYLVQIV